LGAEQADVLGGVVDRPAFRLLVAERRTHSDFSYLLSLLGVLEFRRLGGFS
jgi:hypothetical protein